MRCCRLRMTQQQRADAAVMLENCWRADIRPQSRLNAMHARATAKPGFAAIRRWRLHRRWIWSGGGRHALGNFCARSVVPMAGHPRTCDILHTSRGRLRCRFKH